MTDGMERTWLKHYAEGVPADVDPSDASLVDLFDTSVERFGSLVALEFFGAETTFAELGQQVRAAAEGLRQLGVGAGDRVAIVLPNCPQHIVTFHAVLRLRGGDRRPPRRPPGRPGPSGPARWNAGVRRRRSPAGSAR